MIDDSAIKKYLDRRQEDLQSCLQAMAQNEFSVIENVGHKIKGNGTTFGYPELSALGEALESAAKKKDRQDLEGQLQNFKSWVASHHQLHH